MATKKKRLTKTEIAAISCPKGGIPSQEWEVEESESPKHRRGKTYTLLMPNGNEMMLETDLTRTEVATRYPKSKIIKEIPYRNRKVQKVSSDDEI